MRAFVWLVFLAAVAGGGWWVYTNKLAPQTAPTAAAGPPGGGRPPMPVPIAVVQPRAIPIQREYAAALVAVNTVEVRAKATGFILERKFIEGTDVAQGDLLYQIDPRDYRATLDRVRAQNEGDQAALALTRASLGRTSQLAGNQFASRDALDRAQTDMARATAAVNLSRAQTRQAELDLSYTEIRAPIAGRIGRALFDVGTLVSAANTQMTTIVQLDPIYVSFAPADADLPDIQARRQVGPVGVEVLRATDSGQLAVGTLEFINNAVDVTTSTIAMRGTVPNPGKTLVPGQFVRVRLDLGTRPDALLIPQKAVASDQTGKYVVLVSAENRTEFRPVKLGVIVGDQQVVEAGLKAGDRVIVEGIQKLGPGMPVAPFPAGGRPPGAPAGAPGRAS